MADISTDPLVRLLRERIADFQAAIAHAEALLMTLERGYVSDIPRREHVVAATNDKAGGLSSGALQRPLASSAPAHVVSAKEPTIAALLQGYIEQAGRGLHRSEIMDLVRRDGRDTKPQSVSGTLSIMATKGDLVRGNFDGTANTVHWFLRDFVETIGNRMVLKDPRYTPQSDIARRFGAHELTLLPAEQKIHTVSTDSANEERG